MPSFYIPLSGLNADSTSLNTIANNLSNMNTNGFKSQTTTFSDLLYQQVGTTGSGDGIQVGSGVQVATNSTDFSSGDISSTGVATDAAISGAGFFVLDAGSSNQSYTQNGSFQVSTNGTLQSADGLSVMGYAATKGVVNTSGTLSDITIPTGQVMQPAATTTMSTTQNLDSADAIGATVAGQVPVYDSLGNSYQATITYTKTANNTWAYNVSIPDTLSAAPATAAASTTMAVAETLPTATSVPDPAVITTAVAPAITSSVYQGAETAATTSATLAKDTVVAASTNTTTAVTTAAATTTPVTNNTITAAVGSPAGTYIYNFSGTGATVAPSTALQITGLNGAAVSQTTALPTFTYGGGAGPVETLANYVTDLNTAITAKGIVGVSVTSSGGQLSIVGPATMTAAGAVNQDFTSAVTTYNFAPTAIIDPASTMTISGTSSATGLTVSTAVPTFTGTPETVSAYAADLNTALTAAHIVGVNAVGNNATGALTITGPSTTAFTPGLLGGVGIKQDVAETTTNYNFLSSNSALATVDPSTSLAIAVGGGAPVTVQATAGESLANYATALQAAVGPSATSGVTVSVANGVLSITGPSTLGAVTGMAITGTVAQGFTGTQTSYSFGSYTDPTTGLTVPATIAPGTNLTNLTITGPTVNGTTATTALPVFTPTGTGGTETLSDYAGDLTTALTNAGITGVSVTANAGTGQLTITGPTNMIINGGVTQNMQGTTNNYAFESKATVDPTTNLTITGETTSGNQVTITAPIVTAGESVATYATALTSALATAKIANVSVTSTNGQLSIVGANMTTTGSIKQGLADNTVNYNFGSTGTVNPATNITITGPTGAVVNGIPVTAITAAPTVFAGETVAQYATALSNALTAAGINTGTDGVKVTVNGGQLSIVGPAATFKTAGTASQDLTATTVSYDFGSSSGALATVDPSTNLTITGQTTDGSTSTITAPTVIAGDTVAQYATALNSALTAAGITGITVSNTAAGVLSITGANLSTTGKVVQNPVASTAASGTLTFDTSGNLVSPATDVAGMTFSGLSDGAATMNVNWGLFGASGTGQISQTSAASTTSATSQNGYSSGQYESFKIDSSGLVTATYSNSQTQTVGQLAVATVINEEGLTAVGSTEYKTTTASGIATVGVAGTGGRGTIEGSSLEASNVNISAEFSDLIVAQRAFEANSKAVTTFDTITQETINMIH